MSGTTVTDKRQVGHAGPQAHSPSLPALVRSQARQSGADLRGGTLRDRRSHNDRGSHALPAAAVARRRDHPTAYSKAPRVGLSLRGAPPLSDLLRI
jgi:hypothetical protein